MRDELVLAINAPVVARLRVYGFPGVNESKCEGQLLWLCLPPSIRTGNSRNSHLTAGNSPLAEEMADKPRQIAATDKKIDEMVYRLYGVTEKEIRIVEGKDKY